MLKYYYRKTKRKLHKKPKKIEISLTIRNWTGKTKKQFILKNLKYLRN